MKEHLISRYSYSSLYLFILLFISNYTHAQIITTIAGKGTPGYSGDGGPATAAQLYGPSGLTLAATGDMYITDGNNGNNSLIRKINASGIISTYGGNDTIGYRGDGMPATNAEMKGAQGLATDTSGNLYIADDPNFRIRKIDTADIMNTFAGVGLPGYSGDGIAATTSKLWSPTDVAVDKYGSVYIADFNNHRIRKVNGGVISTIAGTGVSGYTGDGLPATDAELEQPSGIALDGAGNLFIADSYSGTVRRIDASYGIITTVGGNGIKGYSGDNGPATNAEMTPLYVAADGCGNLYTTENSRVRRITPTGTISTIAGNSTNGYSGDGGLATAAILNYPWAVKADAYLNIYFADNGNNVIRRISNTNHPPAFTAGHVQYMTVCSDTALNTLLAVTDADTLQTETWSVLTAPAHGTLVAAYAAPTTGGAITPAGLSYTPVTGYAGADSFKVQVRDCGSLTDSIMVYVTVEKCGALETAPLPAPTERGLSVYPNPNDGTFTVILSAPVMQNVHVVITNIIGEKVKEWNMATDQPATIQLAAPAGVYFLNASTKDGSYNAKVVLGQ